MAQIFHGFINNNDCEDKIKIILEFESNIPKIIEAYINEIQSEISIGISQIIINNICYNYNIQKTNNEIIMAGIENSSIAHFLFPCLFKPKYFTVTNAILNQFDLK